MRSRRAVRADRADRRWYKRAYELTQNRELKVKAAFMAAKAELGTKLAAMQSQPDYAYGTALPTPTTWFPIVKTLADTKYYQDILRECGNFSHWATAH